MEIEIAQRIEYGTKTYVNEDGEIVIKQFDPIGDESDIVVMTPRIARLIAKSISGLADAVERGDYNNKEDSNEADD